MSEGGVYPWKRTSAKRAVAAPDYQRLLRPLPAPPAGLSWIYDAAAPQKWILVAHTNVAAVQEPQQQQERAHEALNSNRHDDDDDDDEWTRAASTTATRVVPLETDSLLAATAPSAVFAEATVAAVPTTEEPSSACTESNNFNDTTSADDDSLQRDGIAMLPQARMVSAATASSAPPSAAAAAVPTSSISNHPKTDAKDIAEDIVDYTRHVIMPTDTLAGLCLMYKISRRELQRVNKFYGNDLRLAPRCLYIPITDKARRLGWKAQDVTSPEFKMAAFLAQFPALSAMEAKCYLETNDWNLEQAVQEATDDVAWERQQEAAQRQQQQAAAIAAAKDKGDAYASLPEDAKEEEDNDCLPCFKFLVSALRALTRA